MAFLHEEEDDNYTTDERKEYGAEDRYSSEPQKVHLTGEFVIVAKFGGHALHHLASRLANVIREGGREGAVPALALGGVGSLPRASRFRGPHRYKKRTLQAVDC